MTSEIGAHSSDCRPLLLVETQQEWRAWLERNHGTSPGVWLVSWKQAAGKPYVSYGDTVDEALCFGNFPPSSQKNILWWIKSARKPETRAARITKTTVLATENRMANHPAGRDAGPGVIC